MRRITLVVWSILAAIALVGCTAAPEPAPTSTATSAPSAIAPPTPTATATPTPTVDAARSIVVRSDGFHIVSETGAVLFSHDWPDAAAPAVAELTRIFGSEPALSETAGDQMHFPDYRRYTWPGFEFRDSLGVAGARDEYFASSGLDVTVAAVNGIQIVTETGVGVGSDFDEVRAGGVLEEREYDGTASFLLACESPTEEPYCWLAGDGSAAGGVLERIYVPAAWGL